MIFKRRFNATFIVLIFSAFVASERKGEEYKFDVDDLQVVYSDPPETVITPPSRYLYSKEIAQCPSGESKTMLTLLLQSLKWSDVGEKKKEKAIKKMSRFFLVPVNYIKVDDIHTTEMLEMLKHSINKSNNLLNTKETVGRIEFPIGCGDKLFPNTKTIAHKINEYVKSEKLQELSGLPIHWWNVWSKHVKSRVQRTKRQIDAHGSGEGEDDYVYDENEDTDDGDEDLDPNTGDELPDNVIHYNNQRKNFSLKQTTTEVPSTPQTASRHDELPIVSEIENNNNHEENRGESDNVSNNVERQNFDTDYQISPEDPSIPSEEEGEDVEVKEEILVPDPVAEIEDIITQRTSDNPPTPIGSNEILKLEKDVAKTIENDNNVGDVPPPSKQQDDKILEEWAQNVFSRAPSDEMTASSEAQSTILTSSTTESYRHNYQEQETTVKEIIEEKRQEIQLSTADIEELLRETLTSTIGVASTTTAISAQPESETIFAPINNSAHNEHINVFIDEKLPIVTSSTIESTSTRSTLKAIEQESILTEENITERIMPTISSSSSLQPSSFIPSSSNIHEMSSNYPITTNPSLTTTSPAEITTIISTRTEPSITETTTTTLRNVDATIAHVATVDKVTPSSRHHTTADEKKSEEESNYDDEYDDDNYEDENAVDSSLTQKPSYTSIASTVASNIPESRTPPPSLTTLQEDDDDEDEETEIDESVLQHLSSTMPPTTVRTTTTQAPTTTTTELTTTSTVSSTLPSTTTTTLEVTSEIYEIPTTSESSDYDDYEGGNNKPYVAKRMKKLQATAGKTFTHKLEDGIFYDDEDKKNLKIELLDKNGEPLSEISWIRYNAKNQEIYGLPLENDVSRHEFKLRATDKEDEYVDETVEITVHQHKTLRSVNHEIYIQVTIEKEYESVVDWEIRLIRGIVEALDDDSIGSIFVRDIKQNKHQKNNYTFVYSNDTLPKDYCPKVELEKLMARLTKKALTDALRREITVRNVQKDLINACAESNTPHTPISPPNTKNYPPTVRNAIDKISAVTGQLLVFEVPKDTFYDPEDFDDLKLTLLNEDRSQIDPNHWLQFDSKNKEFYGVPTSDDRTQQYVLVAEDKSGLKTNDALVVEINNIHARKDYSATFDFQMDILTEHLKIPSQKRKFIERLQQYFGDPTTNNILIKAIKKITYTGFTSVIVQNTTLMRDTCPNDDIKNIKNHLLRQDGSVQDNLKKLFGPDFGVQKIVVASYGKCIVGSQYHHPDNDMSHVNRPDEKETPIINQDVLITYVLPSAIILLMLLIALLIACLLYKRRNTGKMELGDEEERKSFRSKGIPVIFQDELDEKPEIVTKSPVILKDEKPPLLPQYNGLNHDGEDENVDQYIPPQPLLMGSRESRGKSPVTPSYRKPPPYVSP